MRKRLKWVLQKGRGKGQKKSLPGFNNLLTQLEDHMIENCEKDKGADKVGNGRREEKPNKLKDVQNPYGLRGGGRTNNLDGTQHKITHNLQLINRRNDCFANSVIQLLRVTHYGSFLKNKFSVLANDKDGDYKVSKALSKLFNNQSRGQVSADSIRRYVAQRAGKMYLNEGTQQDAEEFFRALEETISLEFSSSEEFRVQRRKHWGEVQIRRSFCDNTQYGKCGICNQYPTSKKEQFLMIQLHIPRSESCVSITSVIQNHFSESIQTDKIRCPNCCPHDRNGVICTHKGVCRDREAAELIQLTEAPELLFIQLLRYDGTGQKIMTLVEIEQELVLPSKETYEAVATLNHIGETTTSGHYVTHLKDDSGQWMLFDDAFNKQSSLKEANSVDNYILLFKRNDTRQKVDKINFPNVADEVQMKMNNEQTKKGGIRVTVVGENETNFIEDKAEQEQSNDTSQDGSNAMCGTSNECVLEPEQNENPCLLSKKCRGCLRVMERLLTHLNSKKGAKCLERYTGKEIDLHKQMIIANKNANYRKKNREDLLEKMKQNHADNREHVLEKRKKHHADNRENILEKRKKYHADNRENILDKRKLYHADNKENISNKKKQYYKKKRENMTMDESISAFKTEIIWGAIYPCISCHRTRFRNGVTKTDREKLERHTIFRSSINVDVFNKKSKFRVKNALWICHTCVSYISLKSLPKISSANALQVFQHPDCLKLTEVENVLIAPRINFIKMIKLPVSRMLGLRDRIVNVPITSTTIKQTVESLPRTLEEAQVIPISLRKKKAMVGSHFQQYVNPSKIRDAVKFLIGKYPFYEDIQFNMHKVDNIWNKVIDDCEEDLEDGGPIKVKDEFVEDCIEQTADLEEAEWIEKDPVRKHQTETSKTSFLLPENIEANVKTKQKNKKGDSGVILAPGEDQIPKSILREKHPFVLHYPCLFPDGKGGLHDTSRPKKITTQEWIMQRLQNINPIFAMNKPFLFSAVHLVEQQQLMSRMNISYLRGKMSKQQDGTQFLQTEDGYAVFDGLPGTPRYWQKMRYDLIAKMEQFGPPQFFYTLSCANKRWEENSATIIAKTRPDLEVMHCTEEKGEWEIIDINKRKMKDIEEYEDEDENEDVFDDVTIPLEKENLYYIHEKIDNIASMDLDESSDCKLHQNCRRKTLKDFLDRRTENNLQSENVLDVTRNFDYRVKAFRKNVLMAKQSPLNVRYYHDRVEFQAR